MLHNLGERLYQLRKRARLSRKDFEMRHNISKDTLRSWENGSRTPDSSKVAKLANIYKS